MDAMHHSKGLSWHIQWKPFLSPSWQNVNWNRQRQDTPCLTLTILEPSSGGGDDGHFTPAQSVCRYMSAADLQEIIAYLSKVEREIRGAV